MTKTIAEHINNKIVSISNMGFEKYTVIEVNVVKQSRSALTFTSKAKQNKKSQHFHKKQMPENTAEIFFFKIKMSRTFNNTDRSSFENI